MMERLRRL